MLQLRVSFPTDQIMTKECESLISMLETKHNYRKQIMLTLLETLLCYKIQIQIVKIKKKHVESYIR
jgi:hypothetical protein